LVTPKTISLIRIRLRLQASFLHESCDTAMNALRNLATFLSVGGDTRRNSDSPLPSILARIRDKPIQPAGIAVNSQKTPGQNAAIQKCTQFLFHEARYHPVSLPLSGQEGLQMVGNHIIKNRLFGIAGYIQPNALTHDKIRFGRHECAIAR
jgi:hypothetical protein